MLASITPLGERGRRSTWGVTIVAFAVGASLAGAAVGALLGGLGQLVIAHASTRTRLIGLAAAAGLALALDLARTVPGPRRQVNERWLDEYRGWVYGLGYGAQLGLGVTTVVASAATYLMLAAAFLTASAPAGAAVVGAFGAVRGLTPLAAARVHSPAQLLDVHGKLARWRPPARTGASATLAAIAAAALIGGLV
jgi:hypothetical protein